MSEREVAENARRFQELSQRVSQLRITEKSRDGMIRVTVSANGLLTDLVLKDRWHPVPASEIAAEIMDCVRRAQARIPDLLHQTMHDTVGTQDPTVPVLLDDARRRFPEPPPGHTRPWDEMATRQEPKSTPAVPTPRQRATEPTDDDDWDEREVIKDIY
jgi:DNA-binding protein YbaB